MRALDVGSGSGYLTACFALMVMQQETLLLATRYHFFRLQVGENGLAVGIDHVDELVKWSEENVRKGHGELLDKGRLKFVGKRFYINGAVQGKNDFYTAVGDGREGFAPDAPYNAIHVGAAAPQLPEAVRFFFKKNCHFLSRY